MSAPEDSVAESGAARIIHAQLHHLNDLYGHVEEPCPYAVQAKVIADALLDLSSHERCAEAVRVAYEAGCAIGAALAQFTGSQS